MADRINVRLVDLRRQSYWFRQLGQEAEVTPKLKGFYVMDIQRWFAAFAAMAIRREMDRSPDCESLLQLLEEIARAGNVSDYSGSLIPPDELRAHRRRLLLLSSKITHIADKEVAHATAIGADDSQRPTFDELFACIEEFESIAVRYKAYLTGETLLTRDDGTAIPVRLAGRR
jgi:hypothetical protein